MEFHYPTQKELTELFTVQVQEARSILLGNKQTFNEKDQLLRVHRAQKVIRKALNLFKLVQGRIALWDEVALYNYFIGDGQASPALFDRIAALLQKLPYYLIYELDKEPKPKTIDISDRLQKRGRA